MHHVRRAALRAASSSSTSFISQSRTVTTSSPFLIRSKIQNGIPSSVFRRFNSDEASTRAEEKSEVESADVQEKGAVQSAIDSAAESASTLASQAATATRFGDRPFDKGGFGASRSNSNAERRPPVERNLTPTTGIYIGNILFDVTANDLTREFEPFGTVKSAVVATDARGLSKGFGYVEFETIEQATKAIEAKHQAVMEGRRLIVNYMAKTTRNAAPNSPSRTLFIGNLAFEMSDADLNKLFRDVKNVIDVRVAIDRRTGQPRGFAHADFVDVESATKGMEQLNGQEIYGRKLRIDYSSGRDNRSR